jgi:hypothetical protein
MAQQPNAEVAYVDADTGAVIRVEQFIDNLMNIRRDRFGREALHMGYGCGRPLRGVVLPILNEDGKKVGERIWR